MGGAHARCREGGWLLYNALSYLRLRYAVRGVTTASAGEVVVAHPSPAPGTVDGMSGDLGEKGRVWLGQELGRVP